MISRNLATLWLSAVLITVISDCASHYYLFRSGFIALRMTADHSPAMLVGDSGVSGLNACGHAAVVSFGRDTKVVYQNGARADSSALKVGRKVSAFIGEDDIILESCPPMAYATKVIVH